MITLLVVVAVVIVAEWVDGTYPTLLASIRKRIETGTRLLRTVH